jgi:hypothetical protein
MNPRSVTEHTVAVITVTTFLSAWLALSIVTQFRRATHDWRIARWLAAFGLLPRWTFFAPRPCTSDFHILFRDVIDDNGVVTRWTELPILAPRTPLSVLWNPLKRQKKTFIDLVMSLRRDRRQLKSSYKQVSVPYMVFLNVATHLPRDYSAVATQFLILETSYNGESSRTGKVLLSDIHPLRPQ